MIQKLRKISTFAIVTTLISSSGCREIIDVKEIDKTVNAFESSGFNVDSRNLSKMNTEINNYIEKSTVIEKLNDLQKNPKNYDKIDAKALLVELSAFLGGLDQKTKTFIDFAFDNSNQAYFEKNQSKKTGLSLNSIFALKYYLDIHQAILKITAPFSFALAGENLKASDDVYSLRESVLRTISSYVGLIFVAKRDIDSLFDSISNSSLVLDKTKLVSQLDTLINKKDSGENNEKNLKALALLDKKTKSSFAGKLVDYFERLKQASFIYQPGKKVGAVTNTLTWIGNLTFGMINSIVGVGIIFATAVVSPFTSAVDFPSFSISANGKQIYVNVSGMSPIAGKMSMGIFELSNHYSHGSYSDHEGGHAIQSAVLGPFYLPTVMVSYIIFGFDQGFIESWANEWAYL